MHYFIGNPGSVANPSGSMVKKTLSKEIFFVFRRLRIKCIKTTVAGLGEFPENLEKVWHMSAT
jgi:hypothetical protein